MLVKNSIFLLCALLAIFVFTNIAFCADEININTGGSKVIETLSPLKRIAITNPDIADIIGLSPRKFMISAKTTGRTTVTVWTADKEQGNVYILTVTADGTELRENLLQLLPNEKNIIIQPVGDKIALSGHVSSLESKDIAIKIAEAMMPGKVIDILSLGGIQQVMLRVHIAEVSRNVLDKMGVNFGSNLTGKVLNPNMLQSLTGGITNYTSSGLALSSTVTALMSKSIGGDIWSVFLSALKERGAARILAEPVLACMSGNNASFLAGGEIPIPVPQGGTSTTTIQFKQFGVGLKFQPTVYGNGRIKLHIEPEVSELDYTNGVKLNGYEIPAISTRKTETTIEMYAGQSFAIAGILKDSMRKAKSSLPVLGDLPILGTLFSSQSWQRNETELVIIVSPELTSPVNSFMGSPGDTRKEQDKSLGEQLNNQNNMIQFTNEKVVTPKIKEEKVENITNINKEVEKHEKNTTQQVILSPIQEHPIKEEKKKYNMPKGENIW